MNWKFTHIEHPARIALGLNVLEYCVLDILYQSQTHSSFSQDGWTNTGCHRIAKFLDISSGTVNKMFDRLVGFGMMEYADEEKALKRTTAKWNDIAYMKEEDVQKVNVQKVNRGCSKSEHIGVQKVNEKCSKSEHKYKEHNNVSNINRKDTSLNFSPDEISDWENQLKNQKPEKEIEKRVSVVTPKKEKPKTKQKPATPQKTLFSETEYCTEPDGYQKFETAMIARNPKYENHDMEYYYEALQNWSDNGNKKVNWIATAASFILGDEKNGSAKLKGKIIQLNGGQPKNASSPDTKSDYYKNAPKIGYARDVKN